jgi:cytochrome c oxidase subunit 2
MLARSALVVAASGLIAAATLAAAKESAQEPEPRVIQVIARRFAFEPAQIDVAVDERVRLIVTSADGVHGIEVKKLKIKQEIPRGTKPVTIDFTASEPGRFPILCSEYCGKDHEAMTGMLVVSAGVQ